MNRDRLPYLARIVHARPRLFVSVAVGIAAIPLLPSQWLLSTRALIGWDLGAALTVAAAAGSLFAIMMQLGVAAEQGRRSWR